jgi:hypothetical protein
MKFEMHQFFKHINCMDAFIRVRTVVMDDHNAAILYVDWMVQGMEKYWFTPAFSQRMLIRQDQYENWKPYEPKGEIY